MLSAHKVGERNHDINAHPTLSKYAATHGRAFHGRAFQRIAFTPVLQAFLTASPGTRTIISLSAVFFLLFVVGDTFHTLSETQRHLDMVAGMMADILAKTNSQEAIAALSNVAGFPDHLMALSLTAPNGELIFSTVSDRNSPLFAAAVSSQNMLSAQHQIDGSLGAITAKQSYSAILAPVGLRALLVGGMLCAVFVVTLSAGRSRTNQLAVPADALQVAQKNQLQETRAELSKLTNALHKQRTRGNAAQRSKTLFLNGLNHELRTPLNHIIGFADLLRHQSFGALGDTRYLNYAEHIKHSGEGLLGTLSRMIELAELDSGRKSLAKNVIRLSDLLNLTRARFDAQISRAGIRFDIETPDDFLLRGDQLSLCKMLGNVVDNAIRFTPSQGRIRIAAWVADDGIVLEVSDTGIGIPADQLDVLNQSFVLGNTSLETGDCTGLGLAVARAVAERSGGRIVISSTQYFGTTVAISLPLKAHQAHSTDQRAA